LDAIISVEDRINISKNEYTGNRNLYTSGIADCVVFNKKPEVLQQAKSS